MKRHLKITSILLVAAMVISAFAGTAINLNAETYNSTGDIEYELSINEKSVQKSSSTSYLGTPSETETNQLSVTETDSDVKSVTESVSYTIGAAQETHEIGDVNLDGVVNINDATEIQKYGVELVSFNALQLSLADFNKDGLVTISDVTEIQCFVLQQLNGTKDEVISDTENKTSSFESTGKADKVVSNVQVFGINYTDARFLISNFNRHYNGDDTDLLYIYTTDDKGSTANLIKGVRVTEEIGSLTVDLSDVAPGVTIRFDYDFRGINDGTRLQGTGTGFLVKKDCYIIENYEEIIPIDFGFFEKFAVIGDSYASGEIYVADSSQEKGYKVADYYNKSWGQILARKHGATCLNLSAGGLTTRSWLTSSHGLTKMLSEEAQELYLCALGINDEISLGTSYIGTINDITNYDSYSDYADTFYGNYGKIIEQIKEHAPKSKIVLMNMAYLYNATEDRFSEAIEEIAEYYNIPFINIKDDAFYAKDSIYKTGQSYNHPTAPIYAGMAQANERLFNKCVLDNYEYFKDFTGK